MRVSGVEIELRHAELAARDEKQREIRGPSANIVCACREFHRALHGEIAHYRRIIQQSLLECDAEVGEPVSG